MLEQHVIDEVRRLLAEGRYSMRGIARLLGVSRGTVGAVASGKRGDRVEPIREEDLLLEPKGPPVRCRTCGAKVQLPCRACRVREWKAGRGGHASRRPDDAMLRPALRRDHRLRYERIRTCKLHAAACGTPADESD